MSLSKTYLIIGATSGIGKSIAEKLRDAGHNVISASRTEGGVDALHPDNIQLELPERLDGLIYCPGTIQLKPFHRLSLQDFENDFKVNVLGAVRVLQLALPALKKAEEAAVVLFSSVAAGVGMNFHASIGTAKAAIEGLTRSLAAEWASIPIRVNAIAPSLTDTPLAERLTNSPEKREAAAKRHPLARIGTIEDMANAALFLLSSDSSWVSGQILHIDGGMSTLR